MKYQRREITKSVVACSVPKCPNEPWELLYASCLMCGAVFCRDHQANLLEVSTEFTIHSRSSFSGAPHPPHRVSFCRVCRKTRLAQILVRAYEAANTAIKKAGNTVMPIIKVKVRNEMKAAKS